MGIYLGTVMLHLKSQHIRFLAEKIPVRFLSLNNNNKKNLLIWRRLKYSYSLLFLSTINLPLAWASSVRHSFTPSKPDVILSEGDRGGGAKS